MRLRILSEIIAPEIRRMKTAVGRGATHERGTLAGKTFAGGKESVKLRYKPGEKEDLETWERYACHNHPSEGKGESALYAFPSGQDLEAFYTLGIRPIDEIDPNSQDLMGIVVFCGKYYVKLQNGGIKKRTNAARYEKILQSGDIKAAVKELEHMGFIVETDIL